MGRTADREHGFDMPGRMRLVERDLDTLEEAVERQSDALDGIRKVLIGVFISVTTASMLLAANIVMMRGG